MKRGGRNMQKIKLRTKVEVIGAIIFVAMLVAVSAAAVTRTITDSTDNSYTFIRNSNGKYWEATGANLQTAIDDLTTGGTVYVPAGTINVTSQVLIKNKVWLKGSGIGNTVIRQADATTFTHSVIWAETRNNFTISDMTIDGNRVGVTDNYNEILVEYCKNFIIRDIVMINPTKMGLSVKYSSSGMISNIYCSGITGPYEAFGAGESRQLTINNIIIEDCLSTHTAQAIDFTGMKDSTISNMNVNGAAYGMKLTGASDRMNENCSFTNIVLSNIAKSEGLKIQFSKHCSFNNIHISMLSLTGIDTQGIMVYTDSGNTKFISLSNIHIFNSNGTGLTVTADNVSVNNLFVYKTKHSPGVYLSGAEDITMSNVNIQDSKSSGIIISNTLRVTIIGGIISNSGEDGISMATAKYTVLNSLTITNNNYDGIDTTTTSCNNYTISNCYFNGNGKAIDTGSTDNYYIITDNTCYGDAIDDNNAGATKVVADNIGTIT